MRLFFRIARWAVTVGLGIFVLYLGVVFVQVVKAAHTDDARSSDAIVVMGAAQFDGRPTPTLAARLDHALDLYRRGIAPKVVVTGGKQPGDRFTEAEAGANYLTERGVPADAILRENEGRTSWQSLAGTAELLEARRSNGRAPTVVLVSDGYHAARIDDIAAELGLDAVTSPSSGGPIKGTAAWRRMLGETPRVAAGRIFGYGRLDKGREIVQGARAPAHP